MAAGQVADDAEQGHGRSGLNQDQPHEHQIAQAKGLFQSTHEFIIVAFEDPPRQTSGSENQLERQLVLGIARGAGGRCTGNLERRGVRHAEGLGTQLQTPALGKVEVAEQAAFEIVDSRSAEDVPARVPAADVDYGQEREQIEAVESMANPAGDSHIVHVVFAGLRVPR